MADDPVDLDMHRGPLAQEKVEVRRKLIEIRSARRARQAKPESHQPDASSEEWAEAATNAEFLLKVFADSIKANKPCCQELVDDALLALGRLTEHVRGHDT